MLKNLIRSLTGSRRPSPDEALREAEARHRAEDHGAAIAAYRRAISLGAPARAHRQLGELYVSVGEQGPAIEHLRTAVELDPDDADAHCLLGAALSDARRPADAARCFERAIALREAFPEAHYNLGLARFEQADFKGALASFDRCSGLKRGRIPAGAPAAGLAPDPLPRFAPQDMGVNEVKLKHDCEQLDYLLRQGRLPADYAEVLVQYQALRDEVRGLADEHRVVPFDHARYPLVARTYKRPLHVVREPAPAGPVLEPALDAAAVEERYLASRPNLATLDGLLAPAALRELRRFCLESTVWNDVKAGYLGAYLFDGFCSELLLRLAWEFRERLPRIVRGLPLQVLWGYKCDSRLPALGVHADAAAVNVNFWITDDAANLDPAHGGLLVYEHDAPREWGFAKFNKEPDTILAYLESVGSVPHCIPHRANRAVIFDSDLFHASDRPHFREGYANRRVNVTLLYGTRTS